MLSDGALIFTTLTQYVYDEPSLLQRLSYR